MAGCFSPTISPKIERALIAGYTQRINNTTGNEEDEYVYSIIIDRETYAGLNMYQVDPVEAFSNFEYRMEMLKSFEMKAVEPMVLA